MTRLTLLSLLLLGCGRGELQAPPALVEEQAETPAAQPVAPACVASEDFTHSRWECGTVSALQLVTVTVTNSDGTSPWTQGQPQVKAVLRNTTGEFLNYPGVQLAVSWPSLATPRTTSDALYGLGGCGEAELGMSFGALPLPSGAPVTFTARPVHINGDDCPLSFPEVSVTVTSP